MYKKYRNVRKGTRSAKHIESVLSLSFLRGWNPGLIACLLYKYIGLLSYEGQLFPHPKTRLIKLIAFLICCIRKGIITKADENEQRN